MSEIKPYTRNYFENLRDSRQAAKEIVPLVLDLVKPGRVIDVGCSIGAWLSVFKEYGVEDILGVDGDYVRKNMLEIPEKQFIAFDLTKPFRIDRQFDLAVSVEVAEHLPLESSEVFVDSLVRLAPVILFSAAIPFQGAPDHINEQWPDYWVEIFQQREYVVIDCIRKKIWKNDNVHWWYAQNMLVFANKKYLECNSSLKKEWENTVPSQLSIIHPNKYLLLVAALSITTDARNMSPKKVLEALPFLIKNTLKWIVKTISVFKKDTSKKNKPLITEKEGKAKARKLVQNALDEANMTVTMDIAAKPGLGVYIVILGSGSMIRTLEFLDEELMQNLDSTRVKAKLFVQSIHCTGETPPIGRAQP